MSKLSLTNVVLKNNPAKFLDPIIIEIFFDCTENIQEEIEWKLIYVGSAESKDFDQILGITRMGPLIPGQHALTFRCDPPDHTLIPEKDVVGATAIMLTASYLGQEFVRVGYFVNNEYFSLDDNIKPPEKPDFTRLKRNTLAAQPRVTYFEIDWNAAEAN